jgi:acyl phosphate:glycerol-3-phosphate acyltransferase
VLGRRVGVPVLVGDLLKGLVPALVGLEIAGAETAVLAGSAAVLGHTFPLLLRFGGGKGVATSAGVVLALTPLHGIGLALVFVAVLWLFRYVSLASMLAATLYPLTTLATGEPWPIVAFGAVAALGIVVRHRANLGRLRAGTEARTSRFGRGAPARGAS